MRARVRVGMGRCRDGTCVCVPALFDANTSLCLILLHTNFKVVSSDTTHPGGVDGVRYDRPQNTRKESGYIIFEAHTTDPE